MILDRGPYNISIEIKKPLLREAFSCIIFPPYRLNKNSITRVEEHERTGAP
ncbi:hypothetical protein HCUR_00580 [Holospora curviuscula]|uniref:Uncharacterized protein n=1 Tax=Holospora curviuscula TaxID=1082868 RepID=A0A2S5RA90_9PROT|nr:hypothetical protein HCUR_00580 [Holospora curviuscula]